MRLVLVALLLALPAGASAKERVIIGDNVFLPGSLAVQRGERVTFTWEGSNLHNVAVARGPVAFRASPRREGTFRRRMTRPGTYRLVCTIHTPEMRMRLRVRR